MMMRRQAWSLRRALGGNPLVGGRLREKSSPPVGVGCRLLATPFRVVDQLGTASDFTATPLDAAGQRGSRAVYTVHPLNLTIYRTIDMMRDLPGYTFTRLPAPRYRVSTPVDKSLSIYWSASLYILPCLRTVYFI